MVSEEQAPLLEGGGARRKGSGHSLHEDSEHIYANDGVPPAYLEESHKTGNGYGSFNGSPVNGKGGGGPGSDDGGGGPPRDTILSPMGCERLVYSWSDVNVFSGDEQRGGALQAARSLWSRCTGRRAAAPHRKHILKSVFGVAYPGELLAIMGASGAGKTTLLNTLTFRSGNGVSVTGRRCVNGVRVGRNALAALSAYVQQDDLFIGTLTVREHLVFQALVRMDRHIPYARRMRRVDEVISELALSKCENTMIGIPGRVKGISGGEMKRLSFASEVLTDPPLMFCDEPTSGLDSFMAQNVVSVLAGMARKGKTVVCTIHQPSSEVFSLFDKVLLMAEGRVAFLGAPDHACRFFSQLGAGCPSNYNPADFFVQLLAVVPSREESCRQTIEMVCDAFQRSEYGLKVQHDADAGNELMAKPPHSWEEELFLVDTSPYKASWWAQFRAVLWRSSLSVFKEPQLIKVRMLQTVMVALMIVLIYYGQTLDQDGVMNINGVIFICLTNMTFQNVFAVINVFCAELPIFMREHANGMYRVDVYFLCKTLAETPVFLVLPLLFISLPYYLIGLNPEPARFFLACLIIVLVANVATSFGYLISCISSSVSMALSIGPPIVIPFMLFGGFFLNNDSVPSYFKWLSYLSWFKYGDEALLINQWQGVDEIACTRSNATCPRTGHVVLETLSFHEEDFWLDIVNLGALIIAFRFFAFLSLLSRTMRS